MIFDDILLNTLNNNNETAETVPVGQVLHYRACIASGPISAPSRWSKPSVRVCYLPSFARDHPGQRHLGYPDAICRKVLGLLGALNMQKTAKIQGKNGPSIFPKGAHLETNQHDNFLLTLWLV